MFHNRKSLFSTAPKNQDAILDYTLWTSVSGGVCTQMSNIIINMNNKIYIFKRIPKNIRTMNHLKSNTKQTLKLGKIQNQNQTS